MKNQETGEFELVLGNRQLLSGFFVVVILFATFFVMGYIVGRNSAPSTRLAAASDGAPSLPVSSETRPTAASGAVPLAQSAASPAGDGAEGSAPGEPPQATAQQVPEPAPPAPAPAPAAAAPAEPVPSGAYLQVMAVKQEEAEVVARTLRGKGFPASLSPAPKGLTRVLVGPYRDTAALGKAKAELENAGFHPIVKR